MECPHCRATLSDPPERFCPSCGSDLTSLSAGGEPPAPPPSYPPPSYPPPSSPPPLPGSYGAAGYGAAPPGYGGPPPGYGAPPDGGTPWDRRGQMGLLSALIETTRQVLMQPTAFFRAMPVTGGLGSPLLYAVIIGYVGLVASTIYNVVFRSVLSSSLTRMGGGSDLERLLPYLEGWGSLIGNLIFGPVIIVVAVFLSSAILHVVLLALGVGARGFEATARVVAFSQAASIFQIVPMCGGLVSLVYTLVLLVIGLSEAQQTTRGKAAAAVLIPFVLICCCCVGLALVAAFGLAGALGRMR